MKKKKNLSDFIKYFSPSGRKNRKFEDYATLTLVQDNSLCEDNPFHKNTDLTIDDKNQVLDYLNQFLGSYENTFKDVNEREGNHQILGRILPETYFKKGSDDKYILQKERKNNKINFDEIQQYLEGWKSQVKAQKAENDQTIVQLCLKKEKKQNRVIGGFILEYYAKRNNGLPTVKNELNQVFIPASYCILTYIFFDESERKQGLGKHIIKEELPIIINNYIIDNDKKKPNFVFFEVDNPMYVGLLQETKPVTKQERIFEQSRIEHDTIKRLNFFKDKVDARWLDINYVQPRLAADKERVYNLFFMILPDISRRGLKNPFIINKYYVFDFLISFYNTNESTDYNFKDFDIQDKEKSIINKDIDLARTWLSIEIADALDDFENQESNKRSNSNSYKISSKTDIQNSKITSESPVIKLHKLQRSIELLFDEVAEKRLDVKSQTDELKRIQSELLLILSLSDTTFNNDDFYLKEVPKFTVPNLLFDKASVTYHIAINPNAYEKVDKFILLKNEDETITAFKDVVCPIFTSYQNDLLAYNYYDNKRPIKSKNIGEFKVQIKFPYKNEFLSEGRKETTYINAISDSDALKLTEEEKKYFSYYKIAKCFINVMYFKPDEIVSLYEKYTKIKYKADKNESDIVIIKEYEKEVAKNLVWEFVITNDIDEETNLKRDFTEFEIIQLSKLFSGKQEKSNIDIHFEPFPIFISRENDEVLYDLIDIINKNIINDSTSFYGIQSGTIQVDTFNTKILGIYREEQQLIKQESSKSNLEIEAKNGDKNDIIKFQYIDLFSEESTSEISSNENNGRANYKKGYEDILPRLHELFEEYLKDNVDNIELINKIYYPTQEEEEPISNLEVYRNARDFHFDDTFTGFEDRYNENKFLKYFFDSLCGISLGIFDFGRMGYEEVTDTIAPLYESSTDKAMIIMKRGSLFSCCHNNSVYDSSINTIGISPYLIIPNSVLVYNRIRAEKNEELIKKFSKLTNEETGDNDFLEIRKEAQKELNEKDIDLYRILIKLRTRIETYLDKINIVNIFNYSTEQEIYTTGMRDRGIEEKINNIYTTKKELDENIKDLLDVRQAVFNLLITIFLGIISVISFYDILVGHMDLEFGTYFISNTFLEGEYTFNLGAIFFYFIFILFIYYFGSRLMNILPRHFTIDWRENFRRTWVQMLLSLFFENYERNKSYNASESWYSRVKILLANLLITVAIILTVFLIWFILNSFIILIK